MAEPDWEFKQQVMEFDDYLKRVGVKDSMTNVLKILYEMDERPNDPSEFIRLHLTKHISEKVELAKLQEEFAVVTQEIFELQQENVDLKNRLNKFKSNKLN